MSQGYASAGLLLDAPWEIWTPTHNDFTIGNGTVSARFKRGELIVAQYKLIFGSSTTIDGTNPDISLPVTALESGFDAPPPGTGVMAEDGGATRFGHTYFPTTATMAQFSQEIFSTYLQAAAISATIPFTWGDLDVYALTAIYEPA
jgi:hypothetical protein